MGGVAPGVPPLNVTQNLYFSIGSTIFMAVVMTYPDRAVHRAPAREVGPRRAARRRPGRQGPEADELALEAKGLRLRGSTRWWRSRSSRLLTFIPGAPLRNPETGEIFGSSPFMSSLLFIISMLFLAAGLGYGRGAKTLIGSTNVINAIVKTFNGLGGLIFLMLLIAQFITYFNYSNMSRLAATGLADLLGQADIGALPLLIGFILLVFVIDIIMPGVIPKWAIMAPDLHPAVLQPRDRPTDRHRGIPRGGRAGQRDHAADGVPAVHHPGVPAVPPTAGMGTVVSMMMPYTVVVAGHVDDLLHRLVPDGHPAGARARPSTSSDEGGPMDDATLSLVILAAVVVLFVWNRLPVGVVAILTALALWATGLLTSTAVLAGFGDPVVIFIATLFVVSEGDRRDRGHHLGGSADRGAGGHATRPAADRRLWPAVRGPHRADHPQRRRWPRCCRWSSCWRCASRSRRPRC